MRVLKPLIYREEKLTSNKVSILINLVARIVKRIKKEHLLIFLHKDVCEIVSRKNRHYILFDFSMRHYLADWLDSYDYDYCPSFLDHENVICPARNVKK